MQFEDDRAVVRRDLAQMIDDQVNKKLLLARA
jgi:hypothetical protein